MAMLPYSQLSEVGRIRRLRAVARSALAHYPLEVRRLRFAHRGRLTAFDFEDVMRGLPVQDIAITLSYGRERPDHREL
jgi:Ser/Thr protein kinase RdoA (MazF antagonist)